VEHTESAPCDSCVCVRASAIDVPASCHEASYHYSAFIDCWVCGLTAAEQRPMWVAGDPQHAAKSCSEANPQACRHAIELSFIAMRPFWPQPALPRVQSGGSPCSTLACGRSAAGWAGRAHAKQCTWYLVVVSTSSSGRAPGLPQSHGEGLRNVHAHREPQGGARSPRTDRILGSGFDGCCKSYACKIRSLGTV
jgi:hypothetical protein